MKNISIGLNIVLLLMIAFLLTGNVGSREAATADRSEIVPVPTNEILQSDEPEITTNKEVIPSWQSYLDDSVYTVPDFPLVDMPIRYNQGEVILIISDNWGAPEETEYLLIDDRQILDDIQNQFYVLTFPPDRGTTPDSMVYVYQDGVLIKEIPFVGGSDIDEHYDLVWVSKGEIEERIGQKLP